MIHPPPDVCRIVDTTAQFVARNGPELKKRTLANGKGNVKVNFLNSQDPYHAYYQQRVTNFRTQLQAPAQTPGAAAGGAAAAPKLQEVVVGGVPREAEVTLEELIRKSKALAVEEDGEESAQAGREVEMEMDEEEITLVKESWQPNPGRRLPAKSRAKGDDATEQPMNEIDPPMRIAKKRRRLEDRIHAQKDPTKFVVSPITGEVIQIDNMAEHMRISLINPQV